MKNLLVVVIMLLSVSAFGSAENTSYVCKSFDVTHYPSYIVSVEKLASGKFVLLGSKTSTEDFRTYTTTQFWHIATKKSSIEGTTVFEWDEVADDGKVGFLEIKKLSNDVLKADLVFENDSVYYAPQELMCDSN